MRVSVQRRGKRGLSLYWVEDGRERNRLLNPGATMEEAWREAGKQEAVLEGLIQNTRRISWTDFRIAFEESYQRSVKPATYSRQLTVFNAIENALHPAFLDELTPIRLLYFASIFRGSVETVRSYLAHIRLALNWAYRMRMLKDPPIVEMPKGREDPSKGRPLSEDELDRMVEAVKQVRKKGRYVVEYQNLIRGISLSGLRIAESVVARWNDPSADVTILTNRDRWAILLRRQKNSEVSSIPVMPDFRDFLESLPRTNGNLVYGIPHHHRYAMVVIMDAGESAGVVVSETSRCGGGRKYASAHDLRRTFAARWAEVLPERLLAELMRHKSAETTRRYYSLIDADRLSKAVYARIAEAELARKASEGG